MDSVKRVFRSVQWHRPTRPSARSTKKTCEAGRERIKRLPKQTVCVRTPRKLWHGTTTGDEKTKQATTEADSRFGHGSAGSPRQELFELPAAEGYIFGAWEAGYCVEQREYYMFGGIAKCVERQHHKHGQPRAAKKEV